ncbi:MAG: carbon-nitrogen hydrolase family protein [Burkholderiaceae bacterium]|nr:carbon-nitrogen hydrolase family protein [Burkholderiaceae bacterium]
MKRTTPGKVAIAAAQYPIGTPETLAAWEAKIERWVGEGAATGADLLVFPEYAAIEQAHCFGPEVYRDLAKTLSTVAGLAGDRVALHAQLAREHGVHILVGSGPVLKSDGRFVNAAQLITPAGAVGEQEKLVMTPFERDWGISAGGPVRVFDTALGRIGIAICYDSEFPLLVRAMTEAGAEIILVPSCTERVSGYYRVRTGCLARALENGIATVQSPTVGDALWSPAVDRNSGAAAIFVPSEHMVSDTGVIAEGKLDAAQWVLGTVDLTALGRLRLGGEMRNYLDWPLQPGGKTATGVAVEVVDLR